MAADLLSAMPTTCDGLSDADSADLAQSAVMVAAVLISEGRPPVDAGKVAWQTLRADALRDVSRSALSVPVVDDDIAALDTLPRAATYSPDAPFRWTASDTLTAALGILATVDPRSADLVTVALNVPEDTRWTMGAPAYAQASAVARLLSVPLSRDSASAEIRAAVAELAAVGRIVADWVTYRHRPSVRWTDNGRTVADALSVAPGQPAARSTTGSATSGPASAVVVRHRDSMADAWSVETVVTVETVETVDAETGETVETVTESVSRYLRTLSDDDALALLQSVDAPTLRRSAAMLDTDRWADRLAWTPGPVAKVNRRKSSRVGSTGPTVPVRLR